MGFLAAGIGFSAGGSFDAGLAMAKTSQLIAGATNAEAAVAFELEEVSEGIAKLLNQITTEAAEDASSGVSANGMMATVEFGVDSVEDVLPALPEDGTNWPLQTESTRSSDDLGQGEVGHGTLLSAPIKIIFGQEDDSTS